MALLSSIDIPTLMSGKVEITSNILCLNKIVGKFKKQDRDDFETRSAVAIAGETKYLKVKHIFAYFL